MVTKQNTLIHIPNAPAIPGLTYRLFRGADDYAIIADIINTENRFDDVQFIASESEIAHEYEQTKDFEPARDVIFAEVNGKPVAMARVFWLDRIEGMRIYRAQGWVLPGWRRKGLAKAFLAYNEAHIRNLAAEQAVDRPRFYEGISGHKQAGNQALLKANGYEPERHFFVMNVPLDGELPEPELPDGIEIRPVEDKHIRPIWDALQETFRDHWGHVERDDSHYERWVADPEYDRSLWKIAWDGDQVAGLSLNIIFDEENKVFDRLWGWVDDLGVRRPWRRRGLGRALLQASHREFKARGMQFAVLGVDAENPNEALHLYESNGYKIVSRTDIFRKELK
jgi:mycothiol synthase